MTDSKNICLCCGQELPAETAMNWNAETRIFVCAAGSLRFTPRQARYFDVLFRRRKSGPIGSRIELLEAAYEQEADGGPEWSTGASVAVHQIRKLLKPMGYTITESRGRPKIGFRFVAVNQLNLSAKPLPDSAIKVGLSNR